MRTLPDTDIYAVLSDEYSRGRGNVECARLLLDAGVKIIQYREKNFTVQRRLEECTAIKRLCAAHGACFIINDDVDLARAVQADGLHLGQSDTRPEGARRLIGDKMLLGYSVTTPPEIDRAKDIPGIDYLGVGPVFATGTKPDAALPGGLALVDYALANSDCPIVAIGGIKLEQVGALTRRGVRYLAMVSELVGAEDIRQKVVDIRAVIAGC
jgi:thiamine-phosphate pyrophosphorylase